MMPRLMTFASLLFGLLTTGCLSRTVPFTHELRQQNALSNQDLQELQFYLSHSVKLRREIESGGHQVEGGHLRLRAGKLIEEVLIEEDTPGVAVAINDTSIVVSFEEGSAIEFALRTGTPRPLAGGVLVQDSRFAEAPDPFPGDRADDDATLLGSYFLGLDDGSTVTFGGRRFEAVGESFRAHLLIDSESLEEVIESRVVLRGRRLGQGKRLPLIVQ